MPAYLILGPSGSGKTTVGGALRRRGYEVIETDNVLGSFYNRETGEKEKERPALPVKQNWLDKHAWNWDTGMVNELLERYKDQIVFFCGGADNEASFFKKFDLRFALCADNQTLVSRLQEREPERWVTGMPELSNQLAWNDKFRNFSQENGAILIDATRTPDIIADDILENINRSGH